MLCISRNDFLDSICGLKGTNNEEHSSGKTNDTKAVCNAHNFSLLFHGFFCGDGIGSPNLNSAVLYLYLEFHFPAGFVES